jgi:glucan phosphoethanolaminetransferase (alkaline phosphatase superfamily)
MNLLDALRSRIRREIHADGRVWFAVAAAVGLFNLPNIVACFVPTFSAYALQHLAFALVLPLLLCVLGMPVRFLLWLLLPMLLLVGPAIGCLLTIHNLPTTFLLLALLETNTQEISSFQSQGLYVALGTLILIGIYVWWVRVKVPTGYRLGPVARVLVLMVVVIPALFDFGLSGAQVGVARLQSRVLGTFPLSTFYAGYEAFDLRLRVQSRKALADTLPVQQKPAFADESVRQVHMLVIGESASKRCFGLYGYDRQTTPLMERMPGVMTFEDATSGATSTILAVPHMITNTAPGQVLEATRQPSVLTAYKRAGYRVYWLSTQRKHGTFDTLTSLFAEDADEAVFQGGNFDLYGAGAYGGASDKELLPLVRSILARNDPKALIVLHTIGSHGPYPARYSPKAARFPVDARAATSALFRIAAPGAVASPEDLRLAQDAYDNSICATDFLLANLVNDLKGLNASTWFCYMSDHGENTSTAPAGKFMHGMVSPEVVEVPLLMWLSPQYEAAHGPTAAALRSHLSVPVSAANLFHTLLDLGGLSFEGVRAEKSLASKAYQASQRLVCDPAGRVSDYDQLHRSAQAARGGWRPFVTREARTAALVPGKADR